MKAAAIGQSEDLARPAEVLNPSAVVMSVPEIAWNSPGNARVLQKVCSAPLRCSSDTSKFHVFCGKRGSFSFHFNSTVASWFEAMVTEGQQPWKRLPCMFTDKSTDNQSTWQKNPKSINHKMIKNLTSL